MKNLSARIYAGPFSRLLIAVTFAALCTGIQYAELWQESSTVEVGKPAPVTLRLPPGYFRITMLRNEFHYLPASSAGCPDMVAKGTTVEPGTECAGLVNAFESNRRPVGSARLTGSFMLFLMIGFLLSSYMSKDGMGRARWLRSQLSVFGLIVFVTALSKGILLYTSFSFAVLPVAMVPLLVSMLLGRRLSFGVTLSSSLVAASLLHFNVQTLFVFLAGGVSTVVAANIYKKRVLAIIKASLLTSLSTVVATALTTLLFAGTLDIYEDLGDHIQPTTSIWLAGLFGGLGAGVLSLGLLPIISFLVGEVPRAKLFDLLELDHPLLKQIRTRAPSTWEHSRAMANLGEAAAHAIGGNAMLLRVGAYFHDVGKSLRPEYFIENQGGGENPHDELTPYDSARAIFSHVVEGVKLLRKERVPEDVIEFSYSHHGTSILEYFWYKNLKSGNTEQLTEADFSYPGNKPTTRETAILMIVDAMEAAARTVENPDKAKFETLLQRIVFGKMVQGQFDESGLTMHDLRIVLTTIIDTLVSMYHARIKYPWQEDSERDAKKDSTGSVRRDSSQSVSVARVTPTPDENQSAPKEAPIDKHTSSGSQAVIAAPVQAAVSEPGTSDSPMQVRQVEDAVPTIAPPKKTNSPEIAETTFAGPAPSKLSSEDSGK
ncbi:MAG: HDIG domain-containing protein [Deltaproteobacteria bacterium]|nr:HDIG domain-containing protein [Deltaproteobacteria bacterium]MBN2672219.1 HDIG domain-containing protein [Deltaproteobacteria bacterium]